MSESALRDNDGDLFVGEVLSLPESSQLRLYYVGRADELPDTWDGMFGEVKSRNAAFADPNASNPKVAREMFAVLKKGGRVYILANSGDDPGTPGEKRHIDRVKGLLTKAGFKDVELTRSGEKDNPELGFHGTKPNRKKPNRRRTTTKTRRRRNTITSMRGLRP